MEAKNQSHMQQSFKQAKTLLLEILSDDMPPKMQKGFAKAMEEIIVKDLNGRGIELHPEDVKSYSTPLRLAYLCNLNKLDQRKIIIKGPKTSAPKEALEGFTKKCGLKDASKINIEEGQYIYQHNPSEQETETELEQIFQNILNKASKNWAKQMTWTKEKVKWVRPIHSICFMLNNGSLQLNFAGIQSSNTTYPTKRATLDIITKTGGRHEAYKEEKITITSAQEYLQTMANFGIQMEEEKRIKSIRTQVEEECKKLNLQTHFSSNQNALEEVISKAANSCETPMVLIGSISQEFSSMPTIILEQTMIHHQNYIPLQSKNGLTHFAFIIESKNQPEKNQELKKNATLGNEKVLSARLQDALYFYSADKNKFSGIKASSKEGLAFAKKELESMMSGNPFSPTMLHRSQDINQIFYNLLEKQNPTLYKHLGGELKNSPEILIFAKLDLRTKAVNDLTELQGQIGSNYWDSWWSKGTPEGTKNIISSIAKYQYSSQVPAQQIEARCYCIAHNLEHILFNLIQNKSFSSSADPFGINRAAQYVVSNSMGNSQNISQDKQETLIEIPLKEDEIALLLPTKYQSLAKNVREILIKRIEKGFLENKSHNAVCSHLSQKTKEDVPHGTREIYREMLAAEIIEGDEKALQTAQLIHARVVGLGGISASQKELLKALSQEVEGKINKLIETTASNTSNNVANAKAIRGIYSEAIKHSSIQNKSYAEGNVKISKIAESILELRRRKKLCLKKDISKEDLTKELIAIKLACKEQTQAALKHLEEFLDNNIINVEDCPHSLSVRKIGALEMAESLESLFPSLKQGV